MSVCYTAIFSAYDDLKEPEIVTPGWSYVCFTDQDNLTSNVWTIVKVDLLPQGAQRTARYYKLMYHRHLWNARSIWIDASFIINCNLDQFWQKNFIAPFSAPSHPLRDCVYLEADACIKNKRDDESIMRNQVSKYLELGIPQRNGMISSGVLMRDMSEEVVTFCSQWWEELDKNSVRDQISFAKVAFDNPNVIHPFFWDYRHNTDLTFTTHLNKRKKLGFIDTRVRKKKRRKFKF